MERELIRKAEPRVFSTSADDPEDGRTFVWSADGWFERIEDESGAVAFTPVADSEREVREWLREQGCSDFDEPAEEFVQIVRSEFLDQNPPYPGIPELSDEDPFREQEHD
jgi:hypothetical protein